jgi:hypothetical protein
MAEISDTERSKNQEKSAAEGEVKVDDDGACTDKILDSELKDGDSSDSDDVEDDWESDEYSFLEKDFFTRLISSCKRRPAFDDSDKKHLKRIKKSYEALRAPKWISGILNLKDLDMITLGFTHLEEYVFSPCWT